MAEIIKQIYGSLNRKGPEYQIEFFKCLRNLKAHEASPKDAHQMLTDINDELSRLGARVEKLNVKKLAVMAYLERMVRRT